MVRTEETPEENSKIFKKIWKSKVDRVRIYEEHSRNGSFGSLIRNRGKRMPCVMPFYEMLVYCDGKVGRCNHDWQGRPLGDVCINTVRDIWRSNIYDNLRNQHRKLQIEDEVCKSCDSWYPEFGEQKTGQILE